MIDSVKVAHEVHWGKLGPYLVPSKAKPVQKIVHHYLDGRVRVESGDVWHVVRVNDPEYTYITSGVL